MTHPISVLDELEKNKKENAELKDAVKRYFASFKKETGLRDGQLEEMYASEMDLRRAIGEQV